MLKLGFMLEKYEGKISYRQIKMRQEPTYVREWYHFQSKI